MLPNYGMFFIFISSMAYIAAILTTVLVSVKTQTLFLGLLHPRPLLIHHLFFIVGLYLSWDIIKSLGFSPVRIFKTALQLSAQSIQFLLIMHAVFLVFHFMNGNRNEFEIVHFLTYLALFFHFKNNKLI